MKDQRQIHLSNVALVRTRAGSFDLRFEGTNSTGTPAQVTVQILWELWPMLANCAGNAWFLQERNKRLAEIQHIEATLPNQRRAA
jgi:hypothetical protein